MKRLVLAVSTVILMMAGLLLLCSAALPAFAQEASPCAKDFAQYCGHITPGGGRLVRCYEENKDKMSAACRAWAEGVKANASILKEACSNEIDTRCNIEKGDPLGMLNCLQGSYTSLSSECVAALNKFKWLYPQPVR
ncbi:MAG TPA: hypothetical protein VEJ22_06945 [Nitrospirota bacterium]|nr:hypothetical protein [Nitrospirota bacterium]